MKAVVGCVLLITVGYSAAFSVARLPFLRSAAQNKGTAASPSQALRFVPEPHPRRRETALREGSEGGRRRKKGEPEVDPYVGLNEEEAALKRMQDLDELLGTRSLNEVINPAGWTQLIFNSRRGEFNSVKLLLMAGADVHVRDHDGADALHYAAGQGHDEIVKALLLAGANARGQSSDGRLPLHRAAGNGKLGSALLLLQQGCDPNEVGGPDLLTALEEAARWEHLEVVRALLDSGANS